MKKSQLITGGLFVLGLINVKAQELSVDAVIRPRFEYRHGFQDVAPENTEGSAFVTQRSSLLTTYVDDKFKVFLDLQSVNTWGDRAQLESVGDDSFRVNQAWTEIKLGGNWFTKVGRQVVAYDDQRILGGLGWADQQRTHDALLVKYAKQSLKVDLGFSFNQNEPNNFGNTFVASGLGTDLFQYKAMQFLHVNNTFNTSFSGSFLFLNNQFQNADVESGFYTKSTTGVYGKYKEGKFGADFSAYYQFGEDNESDLSAYNTALNLTYKPGETLFGLGVEILSGDNDASDTEQNAFFPLFGTNHKFNGLQDFFYVGRHARTAGLLDVNAKAVFKASQKSKLLTQVHYFSTASDVAFDGYLGTEVDLVFIYKINEYANVKVGYSQSFLDDTFADVRAEATAANIQNWGWVMLTVKPNLFTYKKTVE